MLRRHIAALTAFDEYDCALQAGIANWVSGDGPSASLFEAFGNAVRVYSAGKVKG